MRKLKIILMTILFVVALGASGFIYLNADPNEPAEPVFSFDSNTEVMDIFLSHGYEFGNNDIKRRLSRSVDNCIEDIDYDYLLFDLNEEIVGTYAEVETSEITASYEFVYFYDQDIVKFKFRQKDGNIIYEQQVTYSFESDLYQEDFNSINYELDSHTPDEIICMVNDFRDDFFLEITRLGVTVDELIETELNPI